MSNRGAARAVMGLLAGVLVVCIVAIVMEILQ
jgi:hypothetical protein